MAKRLDLDHGFVARLLVWLALTAAFLAYIFRGRELTSVTDFYLIRRSVPEIWGFFQDGLPQIGNPELLDAIYWLSIVVVTLGSLALFWFALAPNSESAASNEVPVLTVPDEDAVSGIPEA